MSKIIIIYSTLLLSFFEKITTFIDNNTSFFKFQLHLFQI